MPPPALDPARSESRRRADSAVDGVRCVSLLDTKGTLWLNKKDGSPVRIASGKDALSFDYTIVDPAEAPASKDIVDLDKLGK